MIYFDNAATTKPSQKALLKASDFNNKYFYNPSALYQVGIECAKAIKKAKQSILRGLNALENDFEVIFTSCGTESDNMSVFSAIKRGVYVTDKGEHSAIYKSFCELKQKGEEVVYIDLNPDGTVDVEKLFNYVENNRVDFVSILHVNNETGGINDINYIAEKLKKINPKIVFHSDGVQAYGKIPFVLSKYIDLYSISAHKINGLKGTGALIKRKTLNLNPIIYGGGQENGLRSGTENVFGIKVFEYALEERYTNIKQNFDRIKDIKAYIEKSLDKKYFKIISGEKSSPYILSVSALGLRGEVIMHALEEYDIIVGNGSACSSRNRYSRVIEACGYSKDVLDGVIRISFSPDNTMDEASFFVEKINEVIKKFKGII